MNKTASIPDFVISVNQRHEAFIVREPYIVKTEDYGWFPDERAFLTEGVYPSISPGLYRATAKFEWWQDDFTGGWDGVSYFDDFASINKTEGGE